MTGIEVVVGFLIAWAVKKAKHVGQRADTEVDHALDAGMDRLHDLVTSKLGTDPALVKLHTEVDQTLAATDRTRDRVRLALEDAAATDVGFATQLQALSQQLQALQAQASRGGSATTGDHGIALTGNVKIHAEGGSVAAQRVGNVSIGGERPDPQPPGQPTG